MRSDMSDGATRPHLQTKALARVNLKKQFALARRDHWRTMRESSPFGEPVEPMRVLKAIAALTFFLACFGLVAPANAVVKIHINLSSQRMHVQSSRGSFTWPVSTARRGYVTPRGHYAPTGMKRMHYSRKYDMSPMPHSIFFRGGYAIHGTYATGALGRPVSHGCVRLAPGHARQLYEMVRAEGARISISGGGHARAHGTRKMKWHRWRGRHR